MRPVRGRTVALYGCGVVLAGALIYGFFLASAYSPIQPASEACATARGGLNRDFGGMPTRTPGAFPVSSVCRWPETGEELELVSRNVTVLPLVVIGLGLVMVLGGAVVWRRAKGAGEPQR
ncbi:hypothetical protein [Kribbella sp. CA-293567]|uniref:hypothetical protein n=1 Tax=Kribbella sp. CA-293567 TaxID=3002436 RepID=UPI0022DD98BA|nr:hypothetical protein [Kribbella sp. CA-293567]WBQ05567.1 hypothetical protein OX958_01930 [Kribbella sp. CA-293567]